MANAANTLRSSSSWWQQYVALTHKSWKVLWHRKSTLLSFILAPSVAIVVLYILLATIGVDHERHDENGALSEISSNLKKCVVFDHKYRDLQLRSFSTNSSLLHHCITVAYVPDAANHAERIMHEVANSTSLTYGTDVIEFMDVSSISTFMWKNPGHIDLAVIFSPENFSSYEVWVNSSVTNSEATKALGRHDPLIASQGVYGRLLSLQKALDTAIIGETYQQEGNGQLKINFAVQSGSFTDIKKELVNDGIYGNKRAANRSRCDETLKKKGTIVGIVGSPLITAGVAISTILMFTTLVSEKQKNLVGKLRQMGLKESAHLASWSSVFLVLAFFSSFLGASIMKLIGLGNQDLHLFNKASFAVLLVTMYAFTMAMGGVASVLSSIFKTPIWSMIVSTIIFLGSLFSVFSLNATITDLDGLDNSGKCFRISNNYNEIWAPHKPTHFFEFLTFMSPWFSFARVFYDIYYTTAYGTQHYALNDLVNSIRFLKIKGDSDVKFSAPSSLDSICFMLGMWILSFPLAWYLGQATAGITNGRRPWYFPFQRGYWGLATPPASFVAGDALAELREKSRKEGSLKLVKLSKTYKKGTALREVSVTMNNGEVFALLGHNGAGKSTMLNILTGLTSPTYGEVYFSGYSLRTDLSQIQSVCGICPQFDALWDELNAEDHLRVCAAMQGLHGKDATESSKLILEAVDLSSEGKAMVQTFSGGMKRRLSVSMASLGDHKIIFFDEPTTGVDTINKKKIWQLIEKLKEDKIIVLTTHNMEEADALGDRIAVLHQGALRAVGSSLFLKKEFGSGYQISLLLDSAESAPEVEALIKKIIPGSKIVQSSATNMKVSLNHNTALAIPDLLTELKVTLPGRGNPVLQTSDPVVKEWGISNTTLEEVFIRLSAQNNQQVNEEENTGSETETENLCLLCGSRKAEAVTLYTSNGISVKVANAICLACAASRKEDNNTHDDIKSEAVPSQQIPVDTQAQQAQAQSRTNKGATEDENASHDDASTVATNGDVKINLENLSGPVKPLQRRRSNLFGSQIWAVLYKNFHLSMTQKKALIFCVLLFFVCVLLMKFTSPGRSLVRVTEGKCAGRSALVDTGYCTPELFLNGILNNDDQFTWTPPLVVVNISAISERDQRTEATPIIWYSTKGDFDLKIEDSSDMHLKKVEADDDMNELFISGQKIIATNSTSVGKFVAPCEHISASSMRLYIKESISEGISTFDSLFPSSGLGLSIDASGSLASGLKISSTVRYRSSYRSYFFEKIWVHVPKGSCFSSSFNSIYGKLLSLYSYKDAENILTGSTTPSLAITVMSNAILKTISNNSTAQISTSVKQYPQLQFASGSHYSYQPFQALIFVMMALSLFFPLYVRRIVMERETGLLEMTSIAGLKPTAYWLGNYIYDFILSVAAGSIFFMIGRLVGNFQFVDSNPFLAAIVIISWAHSLNSLTVFTAGLFTSVRVATLFSVIGLIIAAGGSSFINLKYKQDDKMPAAVAVFPPLALSRTLYLLFTGVRPGHSEFSIDIVILILSSTAIYILGVVMNYIRASPEFLGSFIGWNKHKLQHTPIENNDDDDDDDGDSDVINEKERVKASSTIAFAIKTEDVKKVYPASRGKGVKVAVNGLNLGLEYGEIFGLLGANGAGKTTALSMLSGTLSPSAGLIEIGGRKLINKNQVSNNHLSICPQMDIVWSDLTIWTHLMFYAYVKGLSNAEGRASVQRVAADLLLNGDCFNKKASTLSGGQLRRLSFGISLIANPAILLMDEITTGLDPVSRTTIWDVVKKQSSSGRLMLLTTHSMEEADTLCSRIGIMAHGRMKCLGAPLYLKNKFSNGYTLTIVTDASSSSSSNDLHSFVTTVAPDALVVYEWRRVRKYSINNFDLKQLFKVLEDDSNKYKYGIREWQIEQTTLQDVFLRVSED